MNLLAFLNYWAKHLASVAQFYFCNNSVEIHMSAIELMHDNYRYSEETKDCWYTFSKELGPALENTRQAIENKQVYIVSVEDVEDEQGN